jgi:hypothetical protein
MYRGALLPHGGRTPLCSGPGGLQPRGWTRRRLSDRPRSGPEVGDGQVRAHAISAETLTIGISGRPAAQDKLPTSPSFLGVCVDGRNGLRPVGQTVKDNAHSVRLRQNEPAQLFGEQITEDERRSPDERCG